MSLRFESEPSAAELLEALRSYDQVRAIVIDYFKHGVVEDRGEYSPLDFALAHPELTNDQVRALHRLVQIYVGCQILS